MEQYNNENLQQLKYHLIKKQFTKETIKKYQNYLSVFLQFLHEENINPETAKYTDITDFIEHLKQQEKSTGDINRYLTTIRHFYNSLNNINPSGDGHSPAEGVILKGTKRNIPADLLEEKELKELYETYKINDNRSKKNKAILGLLINQAITTEELHKLEPKHLLLEKGKIIIPPSVKNRQRTLKLQANQILELHNYIENIRPEILKKSNKKTKQLFISITGNENIKASLYHMFRALKKTYPGIKNAKQIRRSVIVHKLKTQNLREVQYFAGHKRVSSTERYKLGNIEDLKKEVNKYHPLG